VKFFSQLPPTQFSIILLSRLIMSRGLDWIIAFIANLYTPFRTTGNYSAISNLNNSQAKTATVKTFPAFCVLTSPSLTTANNNGYPSTSRAQVFLSQPPLQNSLPILSTDNCRLSTPKLSIQFSAATANYLAVISS
jgi:hypothetical protein